MRLEEKTTLATGAMEPAYSVKLDLRAINAKNAWKILLQHLVLANAHIALKVSMVQAVI